MVAVHCKHDSWRKQSKSDSLICAVSKYPLDVQNCQNHHNTWIAKAIWAQGMTLFVCVCWSVELQFIFERSNQHQGRSLVCVAFVFLFIFPASFCQSHESPRRKRSGRVTLVFFTLKGKSPTSGCSGRGSPRHVRKIAPSCHWYH